MPENISFDKDNRIIKIDSFGNVSQEDLRDSLEKVLEIVEKTDCRKILVNTVTQTSMPSIIDTHKFASELAERAIKLKHAVVVSQKSMSKLHFVETVSRNRGTNMMIFDSENEAINWLNS